MRKKPSPIFGAPVSRLVLTCFRDLFAFSCTLVIVVFVFFISLELEMKMKMGIKKVYFLLLAFNFCTFVTQGQLWSRVSPKFTNLKQVDYSGKKIYVVHLNLHFQLYVLSWDKISQADHGHAITTSRPVILKRVAAALLDALKSFRDAPIFLT